MWLLPLDSGILTPIDVAEGFGLWEDEDFVYLTRHGEVVATFSPAGATKQSIEEEILRQSLKKGGESPAIVSIDGKAT